MDLGKVLEGHEKKDEILSYFQTEIEKASFNGAKKANNHAKNVKERYKDSWSEFELDPDSEDFRDSIIKLKESIEDYKSLKSGKKQDPQLLKLEKDVKRLSDELNNEKKEKESLKESKFRSSVKEIVLKSMKDNDYIDDDLADLFISRLDISDYNIDPSQVLFKEKYGNRLISDGIKDYISNKPHFKKSSGSPGGGSAGDSQKSGTIDPNKKLSPLEKIKLAHNQKR